MSRKQKDTIYEILKKSGPLNSAMIKERVQITLDQTDSDYPKSTFLNHLNQLLNELKIQCKVEDNKRSYFVEEHSHPVKGGLIVEAFNGRIHVPKILNPFNPFISQSLFTEKSETRISFNFISHGAHFSFSIDNDAFPFNIHLSRNYSSSKIHDEITQLYGIRTIVLELMQPKISSFKNAEHSGHCLLSIKSTDLIEVKDLGATNPCEVIEVNSIELDSIYNEITRINQTVNEEWTKSHILRKDFLKLHKSKSAELKLPVLIMLAIDNFLILN